jgi:hypothetical protein
MSSDTNKTAPHNMAMALSVLRVPGNARERAMVAICDPPNINSADGAGWALIARSARGPCEPGHTPSNNSRRRASLGNGRRVLRRLFFINPVKNGIRTVIRITSTHRHAA